MKKNLLRFGLLSLFFALTNIVGAQAATTSDGNDEEQLILKTDFTKTMFLDCTIAIDDHRAFEMENGDYLGFTCYGVGFYPNDTNSKFPDYTGYMMTSKIANYKYADDFGNDFSVNAVTDAISSITKIKFTQAATGITRGIKISVKGDGDADWVTLFDTFIEKAPGFENTSGGGKVDTETIIVNRTNCQIKFESLNENENAYLTNLEIYGNVNGSISSDEGADETTVLTYSPAENETVSSVSEIIIMANTQIATEDEDALLDIKVSDRLGHSVGVKTKNGYCDYDYIYDENEIEIGLRIPLEETIVAGGVYTYTIPENILITANGYYNPEQTIRFIVDGTADPANNVVLTYIPENGSKVESLTLISISYEDGLYDNSGNDNIKVTVNGEEYKGEFECASVEPEEFIGTPTEFTITFDEPITSGTVVVTIPESYFICGPKYLNSDEIVLTYYVGTTTGVNNAALNVTGNNLYYNLNGQRVSSPTKGIYIQNGKKILVK